MECPICRVLIAPNSMVPLACDHSFCESCLNLYFEHKVLSNEVLDLQCPSNCGNILDKSTILKYLNESLIPKYEYFYHKSELSRDPDLRFCPVSGCEGYGRRGKQSFVRCESCDTAFCFYCYDRWSKAHLCNDLLDHEFDKLTGRKGYKFCPNCKRRVEKNGGCPEMSCPMCSYRWCWYCGKSIKSGHNAFQCFVMENPWNVRMWVIIFLLFSPISFSFILGLFIWYIYEGLAAEFGGKKILDRKSCKYLIILACFLFSPPFVIFGLCSSGVFIVYNTVKPSKREKRIVWHILCPFLSVIASVLCIGVFFVLMALAIPASVILLVLKICRCCKGKKAFNSKTNLEVIM